MLINTDKARGPEDKDDELEEDQLEQEDNDAGDDEEDQQGKTAKKNQEEEDAAADAQEEEDERPARQSSEDESDLTPEQREHKRQLRRESRRRRRQRAAQANERIRALEEGLAKANTTIAQLQGGRTGDYMARVDAALVGANNRAEVLKRLIKEAGESNEFDKQAELTDQLVQVRTDIGKIEEHKAEAITALRQRKERADRGEADDDDRDDSRRQLPENMRKWDLQTVEQNVGIFNKKFSWYKPNQRDPDSDVVRRLDKELTDEGSRPDTADHWVELEERIREELPHRFQKGGGEMRRGDGKNGKRPAMGGGGRGDGNGAEGSGFKLSPARIAAMKDAGTWGDPVARKRQIEYYKKYDKENPPQRSN